MLKTHTTLIRRLTACCRDFNGYKDSNTPRVLLQKGHNEPHCDARLAVALLKECTRFKDLGKGSSLHAEIAKTHLLGTDPFVDNTLIDMYAKCGSIVKAQEVFDEMEIKDVVSWNALTGGYVHYDCGEVVLICFEQMKLEGTLPDEVTYVCALKACASLIATSKGKEIHLAAQERGLLKKNIFVGNALIDMYAKHGLVSEAQKVFDGLPVRDVVSWNTLIAAYVKHDASDTALTCFNKMMYDGVHPTIVTYCCALKACMAIRAAEQGLEIYSQIIEEQVLETSHAICESLISMFIECGLIRDAHDVFSKLSSRNGVAWTALIAGCVEYGNAEKALKYAEQMRVEGVLGNSVTCIYRLKACGIIAMTVKGREIHVEIVETGLLEKHIVVGNALVDMYAKCGMLAEAYEVIENHSLQNVVSWTSLMAGYVNYELNYEALNCFEQMQHDDIYLNEVSFVLSLKACGSVGAIDKGLKIHAELARRSLWNEELAIGNALVDMYIKFGFLAKAHEVFEMLPAHDVISWTTIIAGFSSHGYGEQALAAFGQMRFEGILPNSVTTVCALQACEIVGAIDKGREIHAEIARQGLVGKEVAVSNALINMYGKFGLFARARTVLFDSLRDVVSWTALIAGYVYHNCSQEALICFELMRLEMVCPNAVTLICALKACGNIGAVNKGVEIHACILKLGMMGSESAVGNALLDMYCKCGFLKKAQELFHHLVIKDVVSWNALMSGYADHNHAREALYFFEQMQLFGVSPDVVSFVCSLKACGTLGAIQKGSAVHAEIARKGLLEKNCIVGNALVDMYAKCGFLASAQEVFNRLLVRNPVTWSSLLTAYAQLGLNKSVFSVFNSMIGEGIKPDPVTFMSVLKTCSQTCLVDKGQVFFEAISEDFGLVPTLEHHTCMVDLFGQAGHLDKAVALVKQMPFNPDRGVWHTLLDICQNWGHMELGLKAFSSAVQLDDKDGVAYVRMTSLLADAYLYDHINKVSTKELKIGLRVANLNGLIT